MKNPQLYQVSLEALTTANCPKELSEKVSRIVANDDGGQPNLGRTPEETEAVREAAKYLQD
ncbi:hypothetical protein NSTC745_06323 [Nostoc sp. DSM 114161]|jgi:hypothetical protein|uniref:hypothetical protein n=1 Tax=Nostoc sp. DSM 114161 TaxID=3440143 RepID=UPI004045DFA5